MMLKLCTSKHARTFLFFILIIVWGENTKGTTVGLKEKYKIFKNSPMVLLTYLWNSSYHF